MSEQLSKNFNRDEFECSDGCGTNGIHPGIAIIMELIRVHEGEKPISPSDACRCHNNNERIQMDANENYVPGSSKSKHLECIAVDVKTKDPLALYMFLDKLFPNTFGIGLYSWGIHIDLRFKRARWDRRK